MSATGELPGPQRKCSGCGHERRSHYARSAHGYGCMIPLCTCLGFAEPEPGDQPEPEGYVSPGQLAHARYLGADTAMAAASWLELPEAHALSILEDIDPAVLDQYDPPNLSGEWAGDPTPDSLALEVTGYALEADRSRVADEIASAWEAGRDEVWADALEAAALRRLGRVDAAMYADRRLERLVSTLRQAAEL